MDFDWLLLLALLVMLAPFFGMIIAAAWYDINTNDWDKDDG